MAEYSCERFEAGPVVVCLGVAGNLGLGEPRYSANIEPS